ncbi:MAG: hypothetical protein GY778_09200 [bacterium]|nr:hypothetical protein [bacterium]
MRGENDEALKHLLHSIELDGLAHPQAVRAASEILVSRGDYEQGIALLTGLVEIYPHSAEPLNNLAWNLLTAQPTQLRDPEQALAYAQRAIDLERDNIAFLDTYLHALVANGQTSKARAELVRILGAIPPDHPLRRGLQQLLDQIELAAP